MLIVESPFSDFLIKRKIKEVFIENVESSPLESEAAINTIASKIKSILLQSGNQKLEINQKSLGKFLLNVIESMFRTKMSSSDRLKIASGIIDNINISDPTNKSRKIELDKLVSSKNELGKIKLYPFYYDNSKSNSNEGNVRANKLYNLLGFYYKKTNDIGKAIECLMKSIIYNKNMSYFNKKDSGITKSIKSTAVKLFDITPEEVNTKILEAFHFPDKDIQPVDSNYFYQKNS